ncbi:toll/interleukin-1 receptor domain-containing protein [bacterium]|nr:toll/interleukin-1 receptor domain-containing protein [bacterium]
MPKLFISYKRGTAAINPLMQRLQAANYALWYDKDDIHTGENWREAINRGVDASDALIVGLTPAACASPFVQHEVGRALEQRKLIFPLKLEAIDESEDPQKLGLIDIQYIDFTGAASDAWDQAFARLLADMQHHKALQVTHHDKRAQRGAAEYARHQRYLKKLAARIGYLNLAQIHPEGGGNVPLERVYIDSSHPS